MLVPILALAPRSASCDCLSALNKQRLQRPGGNAQASHRSAAVKQTGGPTMRTLSCIAVLIGSIALPGASAPAQTLAPAAAPVPAAMPFDIPYGAPIALDRAKDVAAAAIAEAKK